MLGNFETDDEQALGIFSVDDVAYFVEVKCVAGKIYIDKALQKKYYDEEDEAPRLTQFVEQVDLMHQVHGIAVDTVGLCYPLDDVFSYEKRFPSMKPDELSHAVRWDIELNCPFPDSNYWSAYNERKDDVWIAAIDEEHGEKVWQACKRSDINIAAITVMPQDVVFSREDNTIVMNGMTIAIKAELKDDEWNENFENALYAALAALGSSAQVNADIDFVNFVPEKYRKVDEKWLVAITEMACYFFMAVIFIFCFNLARLQIANNEIAYFDKELSAYSNIKENIVLLADKRSYVDDTNRVLSSLSKDRLSWHSVFTILGTMTMDGVFLNEVESIDNGLVRCRGEAKNYDTLVEFLQMYETNKKIFKTDPVLENFKTDENGMVNFSLLLKF